MKNNIKKASVVTIGNFDGLHKGHLALINKVCSLKEKHELKAAVFTFNINTKMSHNLIFPQKQLKEYLKDFNIDIYFCPDFLLEIKDLSCEEFVKKYLYETLNAKYVVVGEDFFFGKGKSGNADTLKEIGKNYGIKTVIIKSKMTKGTVLSSTLIRQLLKDGKMYIANKLMYKNFSFFGTVKKGYHIGTDEMSIPTANIKIPKNCADIKRGVYITRTTVDNKTYESITNIGINPTAPKKAVTCETNIFGFSGDIYQKRIKVEFLKYIRNETAFPDTNSLKKQIKKDILTAKKFFGSIK